MSDLPLTLGTRLGVYEVTAAIGEGGMGQVYRATDTTLGRQVAIKILPDAFASDPERLARFEREAKTLASLNHPHIAAIYGFEKSGGLHALVMEPVEGGIAALVHPEQLGGTRHLSAAQFVQDQRDVVALVASQDQRFTIFEWSPQEEVVHAHRVEALLL